MLLKYLKYGVTQAMEAALGHRLCTILSFYVAKDSLLNWPFDIRHVPDLREGLDKRCDVSRMFRFSFFHWGCLHRGSFALSVMEHPLFLCTNATP